MLRRLMGTFFRVCVCDIRVNYRQDRLLVKTLRSDRRSYRSENITIEIDSKNIFLNRFVL